MTESMESLGCMAGARHKSQPWPRKGITFHRKRSGASGVSLLLQMSRGCFDRAADGRVGPRACELARSGFTRAFTQATGMPPGSWRREVPSAVAEALR